MPRGSRVPTTLRTARDRKRWRKRVASIRQRQHIQRLREIIARQDPEQANRSAKQRQERHAATAKRHATPRPRNAALRRPDSERPASSGPDGPFTGSIRGARG